MAYTVVVSKPETPDKPLPIFSKPEFMEAVQELHGLDAYHLKCFKGSQLVALMPIYEKKLFSYRSLQCPAGSYYQGLELWLDENSPSARKTLDGLKITQYIAGYLKDRYKRIKLNLSPNTTDIRGFTWNGLRAIPLYTFTSSASKPPKPLSDERKKITQADRTGYELSCALELDVFIDLFHAMNKKKHRKPDFSYPAFATFLRSLHEHGIMKQYNLKSAGRIVSSNILLRDAEIAYTVFRATDPDALKNGASGLHTMRLLGELYSQGITELDFCGGNVPEVARFKAALGLDLKLFFRIQS
jgi:hypothetical protein